jgi:DNA glycosylase AlkZ-like
MTTAEITTLRLYNQQIALPRATSVYEAVKHLGAMQAQNYPGVLWSIGLRVPGTTVTDITQAIADRSIVRSWPMRGTLHFVPAEDLKWMLAYLTPRIVRGAAGRHRNLALDDQVFNKAKDILVHELQGGKALTRQQLFSSLEQHGIATANQRGVHILWYWSQKALLCCGPHNGKQQTFVLLDGWIQNNRQLTRDEAFAELALRYFTGHGPATVADLANWLKCSLTDARSGLAAVQNKLVSEEVDGQTYWMVQPPKVMPSSPRAFLLPGFDEYLLGYKDRSAMLASEHSQKVMPFANGMFRATLVLDGQIAGVWVQTTTAKTVSVKLIPFSNLTSGDQVAIQKPLAEYGRFIGLEPKLTIA